MAAGRLSVSAGCVVAAELAQLVPLVEPGAVDAVAAGLVAMGQVDGPVGVRRVRPALLARYGLGEQLQAVEDRHRGLTVLSCGHDIGGGITQYRLRLNPEARAVVEAAINTASAPQPAGDGATCARSTSAAATPWSRCAAEPAHAGNGRQDGHGANDATRPAARAPTTARATTPQRRPGRSGRPERPPAAAIRVAMRPASPSAQRRSGHQQ